jgi:uncharacterized protein with HEPN domain
MLRDFNVYLDDILEAIARIRKYVKGLSESGFLADSKTQDAVIRNLEIIGEAARQIPEAKRAQFPQLEWRKVVGLRMS